VRPHWSRDGDAAIAVIEAARVAALTPAAHRAGVRLGMRRASLAAIAPTCAQADRRPDTEAQARQGAALALLQYTPQLAVPDTDTLLLDVGASLQLFGGPRALASRVAATLAAQDLHVQLGMAPTALGAWLLARSCAGRRRVLRLPALARRLDALPLERLPQALERLDWLHDLGCQTLGQVRSLPRAGLQRRGAGPLLQALDAAYGAAPELHAWLAPPASFHQRIELPDYAGHADGLLAAAQRLADQLCGWLAAHQRAVRQVHLALHHERGRHARPPTELTLALAQPAWHGTHLIGLLRERLARYELPTPVIAMTLHAPETVERPAASATLFPDPATQPADHARLLDLLAARLGADRVRRPQPQADHRPEVANQWQDAQYAVRPAPAAPPALDRPFWLVEPPLPLRLERERPLYQGQPLRLVRGPERIESGWWDAPLTVRDYFVAEDAAAARYWIYRERDTQHARWFLHGRYA